MILDYGSIQIHLLQNGTQSLSFVIRENILYFISVIGAVWFIPVVYRAVNAKIPVTMHSICHIPITSSWWTITSKLRTLSLTVGRWCLVSFQPRGGFTCPIDSRYLKHDIVCCWWSQPFADGTDHSAVYWITVAIAWGLVAKQISKFVTATVNFAFVLILLPSCKNVRTIFIMFTNNFLYIMQVLLDWTFSPRQSRWYSTMHARIFHSILSV